VRIVERPSTLPTPEAPGFVARCAARQHVLLRAVTVRQRVFVDLRGMTYLMFDTSRLHDSSQQFGSSKWLGMDHADILLHWSSA